MGEIRRSYARAGVDVEAGERAVELMRDAVESTRRPEVLGGIGGFGGAVSIPPGYREPVIVSSTDGVGTKVAIAAQLRRWDTVGIDLVAMCADDVVCTGAEPLAFLDYVAVGRLEPEAVAGLVGGVAAGCREAGCALVGGETAEHPGMLEQGTFDLAGTCLGIAERDELLDGTAAREGDLIFGLPSSGLHSNGYSLARKLVEGRDLGEPFGDSTLGATLLAPTRIYAKSVKKLLRGYTVKKAVKALANITGGGMVENIPRVIPKGLAVEIREGTWDVPPIFPFLQSLGDVPRNEMHRVFNMGVGMVVVTSPHHTSAIVRTLKRAGERASVVGKVVKGDGEVRILEK